WGTLALLFTFLALLTWFGGWLVRRHYKRVLELSPRQRRSRRWGRLGTLVLFTTLLGWLILMIAIGSDPGLLMEGAAAPWMYLFYEVHVVDVVRRPLLLYHAEGSYRSHGRVR